MPRVTIKEIARRAGVSKGAVSYALNNQPGVSAATRARVLRVAEELEWVPNRAARQLSAARSETFGLVLARTAQTLTEEPFYLGFVGGVESVLADRSYALALQVVSSLDEELATYRKWAAERRVDGVIVVDLRMADPRIALLRKLGLPAVLVGDPQLADGLPCVWTDAAAAMNAALGHVAALGHRRVARVAGPPEYGDVWIRDRAFFNAGRSLGLDLTLVHTDYSADQGAAATRDLLAADPRPTAVIYDNDLMAVAGLSVAQGLGAVVPDDLTLVAWDDSTLCRITHPRLTAMSHNIIGYGAEVTHRLLSLLDGAPPESHLYSTRLLVVRESSGPPAVRPTRCDRPPRYAPRPHHTP
ncbi:LacI family DNA-binding transcriptional regulator [Kribbella sandramycini]|uniref:DNA-binding LacI/PurR family transcriptional regulator n=1 Tax=Kribbella sandramycini TaxID=60450 RepID=A0A7Y4L0X7_9ACTN|nr:DNA-binding LacI/PurR family transcriptional regulator [Kribbella sandramycini]NOL41281.1 LacI family DNA-binding transcriptional regulator [Kribbella sandramycini]